MQQGISCTCPHGAQTFTQDSSLILQLRSFSQGLWETKNLGTRGKIASFTAAPRPSKFLTKSLGRHLNKGYLEHRGHSTRSLQYCSECTRNSSSERRWRFYRHSHFSLATWLNFNGFPTACPLKRTSLCPGGYQLIWTDSALHLNIQDTLCQV